MTDDEFIERIRARAHETRKSLRSPISEAELTSAEARLSLRLPSFYRRLLLEVANGGFGPGYGVYGLPPNGYFDEALSRSGSGTDIVDAYLRARAEARPAWRTPRGLVYLCQWGAGKWSHLDCESDEGPVLTSEWLMAHGDRPDGEYYWQTCPSIREFMAEWITLDNPHRDITVEIIGHKTGKNPFTGKPKEYEITRPRGPQVDFSDRD